MSIQNRTVKNQPCFWNLTARESVDGFRRWQYSTCVLSDGRQCCIQFQCCALSTKKDTVTLNGTYSIFSIQQTRIVLYWQVTFTEVGFGKGDYILDVIQRRMEEFFWIEPVNGVSLQGNLPGGLTITPKTTIADAGSRLQNQQME